MPTGERELRERARFVPLERLFPLRGEQQLSEAPGISLGDLLRDHSVESVDLLKIDCDGGEFAILESTPADVFSRIRNIVSSIIRSTGSEASWRA